jgi:CheY-like chemotaxis protein
MLSELGYKVVEAASAEEVLSLLDREPHIDGIITDHLMPGMSGVDLAQALTKPFRQSNLAASLAALLQQAAK